MDRLVKYVSISIGIVAAIVAIVVAVGWSLPVAHTVSRSVRLSATADSVYDLISFGGRWIYEITPSGGGTELRITEEGEVYNPFFRFVSRFIMGHARTIERYLEDVERRVAVQRQS